MSLSQSIFDLITKAPQSQLPEATDPKVVAQKIISEAAWKSAAISGTLALPVGPLGMITIIPDLVAIWRIQAQMVSDIAAVHGKRNFLTREAVMYCLFKNLSSDFLRDVVVRIGDRYILRQSSLAMIRRFSQNIGARFTQKLIGKSLSRWIPIAGAVAVAWYTRHDTLSVGKTALDLFSKPLEHEVDVTPTES